MEKSFKTFIHPEVKKEVYKEYARLTKSYPELSSEYKLALAKLFVHETMEFATQRLLLGYVYVI